MAMFTSFDEETALEKAAAFTPPATGY